MTWDQAVQAFKDQVPVLVTLPASCHALVYCIRIDGLSINRVGDKIVRHVSALDENNMTVYNTTPDKVRLAERR